MNLPDSLPTALICDDDITVRQLASAVLKAEGYRCYTAVDEDEALSVIEAQPVDVVLMDIYLESSNGIDCIRKMRQSNVEDKTPVIFITSSVSPGDVQACLGEDIGASAYLNKPIVWEALPPLCSSLIKSRRIQDKIENTRVDSEKLQFALEALKHINRLLAKLVASEENRAVQLAEKNGTNLGVLLQINVAHKALLEVEEVVRQLSPTMSSDPMPPPNTIRYTNP